MAHAPRASAVAAWLRDNFLPCAWQPIRGIIVFVRYIPWIGLLLVILLIAEISQSRLIAWLLYALTILVVVAMWVTRRPAKLANVRRRIPKVTVEQGEMTAIEVSLTWERPPGPCWLLAEDSLPLEAVATDMGGRLFVGGGEDSAAFTYRFAGDRRGYFPLGPVKVRSGDLIGFAQLVTQGEGRDFITVHPKIYPAPAIHLPSNRPAGEEASIRRIHEDPTRMIGVRDYQPGDSLSRIHWKSTARTGVLSTRVCEPSSTVEINLLLNLYAGDYGNWGEVELACATAASLALALIDDRHLVGITCNGEDAAWAYETTPRKFFPLLSVKTNRGRAHLNEILDLLGRASLSSRSPLPDYLQQVHAQLPWTATVVLITPYLSEMAALAVDGLRGSGFVTAIILVGNSDVTQESLARAVALDVPMAHVEREEHIGLLEFRRPGRD